MSSNERIAGLRRRHWLIAAPASLVALSVVAHRFWSGGSGPSGPSPLTSVTPGQQLDRWTVVAVHPLHLGAVPVVLSTADGHRYQVDVLARDPQGPEGVANTERLSLFVVNSHVAEDDDGLRRTDEEQGLGALVLADALVGEVDVPGLLTLSQRQRQHPQGAFGVPLA